MIMPLQVKNLKGKITKMEVVEDFESRPHRAVSFVIEREKEVQEWKRTENAQSAAWLQRRQAARKRGK